jgi:hypothetical protein
MICAPAFDRVRHRPRFPRSSSFCCIGAYGRLDVHWLGLKIPDGGGSRGSRRRSKHLYNRVNFLSISKMYNLYVYFARSAPIVDLSNGLDTGVL